MNETYLARESEELKMLREELKSYNAKLIIKGYELDVAQTIIELKDMIEHLGGETKLEVYYDGKRWI